jgi:polyisoprenoid-binding protein YceI
MGSKVGHDLVLEVKQWKGSANVDADDPSKSSLTVTADPRSFEVVEGKGGVKPLSDKDRRDILKNIEEKVFNVAKNPEITFNSTSVSGDATRATVTGNLTMAGQTHPVTVDVTAEEGADGSRFKATIPVTQSQWGIKPYTAFLGALKVRDTIEIDVEAKLSA